MASVDPDKQVVLAFASSIGVSVTNWHRHYCDIPHGGELDISDPIARVKGRSWRLGDMLARWSHRWYGSAWSRGIPVWSDYGLMRALPAKGPFVVHCIFGEFFSPKWADAIHRRGGKIVVNVHSSVRRWRQVWTRPDGYACADAVVLTSECQRPLVEVDVPRERVRTILYGAMSDYFTPAGGRIPHEKLRLFMLGDTERDHEKAAAVAAQLPADRFEWRVRTNSHLVRVYEGIPCVKVLPRLSDEEMREEYRQADLMAMPMLDSAANRGFLDSMCCGTPVMTNRIGGVDEYVPAGCNVVMGNDAPVEAWVERLEQLAADRELLEAMRPAARKWAESLDWRNIIPLYSALHRELLEA